MKITLGQKKYNQCSICEKTIASGYNKPHSLHRTKKIISPNIQKVKGLKACTRCLRTQIKKQQV